MRNWALITGASEGIGRELAKVFASNKFNLVLVARRESRLKELADELKKQWGISTWVLPKNLAHPAAPAEIFHTLRETRVSVLVNNAGFGTHGAFAQSQLRRSFEMMHVNIQALVELTHLFLQPMLTSGEGRILNVASTAAFQPGPFTTMYYASKSFVFSFSVGLAEELSGTGVTVTTLCPGATKTEFQARAGMARSSPWLHLMDAETVSRLGYRGLMRGKRIVIPGAFNRFASMLVRFVPVQTAARVVRKINGK